MNGVIAMLSLEYGVNHCGVHVKYDPLSPCSLPLLKTLNPPITLSAQKHKKSTEGLALRVGNLNLSTLGRYCGLKIETVSSVLGTKTFFNLDPA